MAAAEADFDQSQVYFQKCRPLKIGLFASLLGRLLVERKTLFRPKSVCLSSEYHQENFQPVAVMGVLYWLELLPKARLAFVQPWVTKLLFEPILFYPMFL